jgi:hypothetical protein
MSHVESNVHSVPLPSQSSLADLYPTASLADSYIVRLPTGIVEDPESLARHVFENPEPWIDNLLVARDTLMSLFGVKSAAAMREAGDERIGMFKVYSKSADEIVLGEDDKHLDFRISVLRQMRAISTGEAPYLVVTTVVHAHNMLGKLYLLAATPAHKLIVPSMMQRASDAGWPLPQQAAV